MLGFAGVSEQPVSYVAPAQAGTYVSADLIAAYGIKIYVSVDLAASYSVTGALASVSAELAVTYGIAAYVSANLVGSYSINAALATVSADLNAAYGVKTYVSAELVAAYMVRQMVAAADLVASYSILSEVLMSFTRSTARTLEVLPTSAAFAAPSAGFWNMSDPKKPSGPKDPNSTIDVSFDWRKFLADITDAIVSHAIVLDPGLTDEGSQTVDGVTTVFVSGGTVPGKLPVTCRITTASTPARKEDRTLYLVIEER